jgi:hypothetical protein
MSKNIFEALYISRYFGMSVFLFGYTDIDLSIFHFHGKYKKMIAITIEAFSGFEGEGSFVKGACYFGLSVVGTDHTAAECHFFFVWTKILSGKPFTPAGEIKESYLLVAELHAYASIGGNISCSACVEPGGDCFLDHEFRF